MAQIQDAMHSNELQIVVVWFSSCGFSENMSPLVSKTLKLKKKVN